MKNKIQENLQFRWTANVALKVNWKVDKQQKQKHLICYIIFSTLLIAQVSNILKKVKGIKCAISDL